MHKKILRILSLVLVMVMTVSLVIPTRTVAAPTTPTEVEKQITRTYKNALAYSGRSSFDGYCGAFVTIQLYKMGIITSPVGGNGNEQYDAYCHKEVTTGGYRIKAYSASKYTLKEALNAITKNGTKDVYNILVGFQRTRSSQGQKYGHACVIHAIIDGKVYFMESYDAYIDGKRYREGTPISLTIDAFVNYYAKTTTKLDGVIYFGLKDYAGQCKSYPSYFEAETTEEVQLWSQPCEDTVENCSTKAGTMAAGEKLVVEGLYLNTEGEYWYQLAGEDAAYVRADHIKMTQLLFDDISVKDTAAPTVLQRGRSYNLKGTISAESNLISTIRAQVYRVDGETLVSLIDAHDTVEAQNYTLNKSVLSKRLPFRSLAVGQYRYDLMAVVNNHYVENGQIQSVWETVKLMSADFQVVEGTTKSDTISFDANGGVAALDQTAVTVGDSVGTLPSAQRLGYVFLGWFTRPEGGQRIDMDYVPDGDITLYAQWISEEELQENWKNSGECWSLYSDGLTTMGCIQVNGMLYYFNSVDSLGQNWTLWAATGTV